MYERKSDRSIHHKVSRIVEIFMLESVYYDFEVIELKIGLIGIGLIAKKAYLPVITQMRDIELHICTRNEDTLGEIDATYKHPHIYSDMHKWVNSGIRAAFVHSSTESHEEIIDLLLDHHIHVYVDKPITTYIESTERLIKKAQSKNLVLMVGFNRRYAPSYQRLKEVADPNLMIVQKNVAKAFGEVRSFIFNDFIHVIDTILYLFPYKIIDMHVSSKNVDGVLHHVSIQLQTTGGTAIGIMNRDVNVSLEKVEMMSTAETLIVENVGGVVAHTKNGVLTYPESTWTPTLEKRGFHHIIEHFIERVQENMIGEKYNEIDLRTHQLAEQIVQTIMNE